MDLKYLILLFLGLLSSQVKSDYVAAVVEYVPLTDVTPNQTLETNLNEYRIYLGVAKRSNVQIIVFPEYGLTGLIDDPTNYSVVIPDVGTGGTNITDYVVRALSEAAIEHSMYIVINVAEKAVNEKNKTVYYNTNVVFDKAGTIVAKYRKINLYDEPLFTPGTVEGLEKAVFTTDFGRNFGTFICFDVLFNAPSRKILNMEGANPVQDVAYPTAWYSIVPFYHSLSVQQSYAAENKVNLLAANINFVKDGQGGSGIYGADGTVYSYYLTGKPASKLLISTVKTSPVLQTLFFPNDPVNAKTEEMNNYITPHYFKASEYKMKPLNLSQENISEQICDSSFCCDFTLNLTASAANNTSAIYQLMAFRGSSMFGPGVNHPSKLCFLVACESQDPNTCGTRNVNSTATFRQLSVRSTVRNEHEQYYVPMTLTTDLLPVFNNSFVSVVNEEAFRQIELLNTKEQNKVLLFGIFSNGVDRITTTWSLTSVIFVILMKYLF